MISQKEDCFSILRFEWTASETAKCRDFVSGTFCCDACKFFVKCLGTVTVFHHILISFEYIVRN